MPFARPDPCAAWTEGGRRRDLSGADPLLARRGVPNRVDTHRAVQPSGAWRLIAQCSNERAAGSAPSPVFRREPDRDYWDQAS